MIKRVTCEECGATLSFDDTKPFMFCVSCGAKIDNSFENNNYANNNYANNNYAGNNIVSYNTTPYVPAYNSSLPVITNGANLVISYASSHPGVRMVIRFVPTNERMIFSSGMTKTFRLNPGPQILILKIGNRNYRRDIFISPNGEVTRIEADWMGRAHIRIF